MANNDGDQSLSPLSAHGDDDVFILGELVGAYQLSLEEHLASKVKQKYLRPYCIVKFRDKTIHYTSPTQETGSDPIWTVSTGSLFLVKVTPSTLLQEKLKISIWSKKNVTSLRGKVLLDTDTYFLGKASIDGPTLLSLCNEERIELPLEDKHGNEEPSESTIALRFRLATGSDVRLISLLREQGISPPALSSDSSFNRSESQVGADNPVKNLLLQEGSKLPIAETVSETNESQVAGQAILDGLAFVFNAKTKSDKSGMRKVRTKPGPDPARGEETKYMTPLQISQETRNPSLQWVDAGSGQIGTLHLEILACHGLPNVDVGEAVGNLTDCFVCAVFEDVMVQTPVIDDELSPHWLPWTQRAFRIGIVHPSSTLYLGALDYDLGPGTHEPIGRVAVNLSNFQPNTQYTLRYALYPTSDLTERNANGNITFRMRIEYPDEKAAILAARQPKPVFHVNTRKHKTFKVLRYTCFGEYDVEEKFAWPVTKSYIGEILEYWRALKFYTGQCFWSLVFWRGQVEIYSMKLPVHSAMLFVSGAVLVEKPWLIVPFYCLFAAWFMLATMSHRRETPSPWHTCHSFLRYAEILLTGKASDTKEKIRPMEYSKKTEEYESAVEEWIERYQSNIDKRAAMEEKLLTIGNENISTTVTEQMIPLDLLERLGRYQGTIGRFCTKLRRIKSIIVWEDSIKSFWLTATCLITGLVTLVLPWRFILYHGGRIIVWGFLGPHMRLVDLYYQQSNKEKLLRELQEFREQSRYARIRREEAVKLKDMKCLAFGEYVAEIPSENLPRHYDRPLHESLARYVAPSSEGAEGPPATSRIPGQQLYGAMIPHTKSGFLMQQAEAEKSKARLAEIKQQLKRLQEIEDRLSSRSLAVDDEDLLDDLGVEITLSGEKEEDCEDSPKSIAHRHVHERLNEEDDEDDDEDEDDNGSESVFNQSLRSQEGVEVDQNDDCFFMTPIQTHPKLGEKKNEMSSFMSSMQPDSSPGSELSPRGQDDSTEGGSIMTFVTPSNELDKKLQMFYMTPEQGSNVEEKKEDDQPTLSLAVPELNISTTKDTEFQQQPTPKSAISSRRLMGPRGKEAAAQVPMALDNEDNGLVEEKQEPTISNAHSASTALMSNIKERRNSNAGVSHFDLTVELQDKLSTSHSTTTKEEFQDIPLRKTWSSSSLQKEKTWIKENPTDTILELKSSNDRRRSSVVCEQGLEIIAMGRLQTIGDDGDYDDGFDANDTETKDNDDGTIKSEDHSAGSHHGLSIPYKSDNYVDVATFRP